MSERFSEAEAARRLGISKGTLIRERIAGRIHPIRIGQRIIHYTQPILDEYERQCRNIPAKSETSGSAGDSVLRIGAERGTTLPVDRQGASLLAQQTFKRAS